MMEQFNLTKKLDIALIAEPVGRSGTEFLTTLIKILVELSENLYVTTGNFPVERFNNSRIRITNVVNDPEDAEKGAKPALIRKFVSKQMKLSIAVIKLCRKADVMLFMGLSPVLPILLARIMGKKTIRIAAASLETHARLAFGTKSIFYHVPVLLEKMSFILPHQIAEDSHMGLEKYGKKVVRISRSLFIDTTIFKPTRSLKERKNTIGYIGRMEKVKGILNFVEAMPLILKERPDVEFIIGGDGALTEKVKDLLNQYGLNRKTKFCGWIAHDRLPEYFNEMKLIVCPSYSEADWPAVAREAMACGTPVLTTPVSEGVKDGIDGFIMPDNSPKTITQHVIRVLKHPDLLQAARNGQTLIEKEYSLKAVVECYRGILYPERNSNDDKIP